MNQLSLFKQLLLNDFYTFKSQIKDKLIDLFIWVFITTGVTSYLMPLLGVAESFGPFTLVGLCASAGLFEQYASVIQIINDFEGDRIIDYQLTLPISARLIFIKSMLFYAFSSAILSIGVIPLGNLFLKNPIAYGPIAYGKLALFFIAFNLLYGALTLFLASFVKDMTRLGSMWMRIIYPMWFLGGFQFSWKALYSVSKAIAFISLANPMTYIMEGLRATVLGQADYISFWVCLVMVLVFTIVCGWIGMKRLIKRLDCV